MGFLHFFVCWRWSLTPPENSKKNQYDFKLLQVTFGTPSTATTPIAPRVLYYNL
jgi:hypothetical protein